MLAIAFHLVPVAGGGDLLAVGRLEPPTELLCLVLVHLKLQLGGGPRLDNGDPPLGAFLRLVTLAGGGQDLPVGRFEPPTVLLRLVLVDFELQLPRRRGLGRLELPRGKAFTTYAAGQEGQQNPEADR